jgi:hypothetical protein
MSGREYLQALNWISVSQALPCSIMISKTTRICKYISSMQTCLHFLHKPLHEERKESVPAHDVHMLIQK